MVMKVLRRAAYGLGAWLFVFVVASVIFGLSGHDWPVLLVAPPVLYYLAIRALRKKKPDFGSEGLKLAAVWLVVFGVMDFVVMPLFSDVLYHPYLSSWIIYLVYFEVLAVPYAADMVMTGSRKI